ncbi:MAG: type II secretion system F family protein [Acidobacteriota bacterium]
MTLLLAVALFVALAGGLVMIGMRLWVKPKAAVDRVTGLDVAASAAQAQHYRHPSLVFREMLARLGTMLPSSPKDITIMQRRLYRAGFRSPGALKNLYGAKAVMAVLLPLVMSFAITRFSATTERKMALIGASVAVGFFAPNEFVRRAGRRRQKRLRIGLPNALDLLVVCVEAGLGLDQAIVQTAKELEHAHPEISDEFVLVNLELRAGKRRVEALRNLGERSDVDELKKLVAVLIQADRFGTGIAVSLRGHSDYMRVQARQVAEEKAAKLGVKLVFPIFFCIMPTLFLVTVGPIIVRVVRELLPMINAM